MHQESVLEQHQHLNLASQQFDLKDILNAAGWSKEETFNSLSSGDKFHIFHSIASDINISTSIYPPLKRKPLLQSS